MSEIKLVKRIKYAGDVHAALMKLGWDAKTAAAFLDSIPDVDKEDVFEHLDLMKEAFEMAKSDLMPVVRCGLCKHWDKEGLYCHHPAGLSYCGKTGAQKGFCYFGERRAD